MQSLPAALPSLVEIQSVLTSIEVVAPVVIITLALARLQFAPVVFSVRYMAGWNLLRRVLVPILQTLIYRRVPFNVEIENHAVRSEHVATVEPSTQELALAIDGERDVEVPLLAGLKTDWDDNTESGTFVWYCGQPPKIKWLIPERYRPAWLEVPLPRWLAPFQVHVTVFDTEDGRRVTAHFEANPWRPDQWADHLLKRSSYSAEKGVEKTHRALKDADVEIVTETVEA